MKSDLIYYGKWFRFISFLKESIFTRTPLFSHVPTSSILILSFCRPFCASDHALHEKDKARGVQELDAPWTPCWTRSLDLVYHIKKVPPIWEEEKVKKIGGFLIEIAEEKEDGMGGLRHQYPWRRVFYQEIKSWCLVETKGKREDYFLLLFSFQIILSLFLYFYMIKILERKRNGVVNLCSN